MKPVVTAFAESPDQGEGHARDMRVRWALEEVGQPYDVRLLSMTELKAPPHRARNPFGKIPTYEEGDLTLFESGAITFHIAERYPGLLPNDPAGRARAVTWMFAALSTNEPPIVERDAAMLLEKDEDWYEERQQILVSRIRERLGELASYLGNGEWLDGAFSAGDLLMVTVLRRLEWSNTPEEPQLFGEFPSIAAYVARGKERPAFQRAFAAQREVFDAASEKP
jgi:glutathione S-transferase